MVGEDKFGANSVVLPLNKLRPVETRAKMNERPDKEFMFEAGQLE